MSSCFHYELFPVSMAHDREVSRQENLRCHTAMQNQCGEQNVRAEVGRWFVQLAGAMKHRMPVDEEPAHVPCDEGSTNRA